MTNPSTKAHNLPFGLRLIATVKIVKGIALAGVALGLFQLVHRDLDELAREFIEFAKISPENRYASLLLEKAGLIQPRTLMRAGIGSALYASILLSEGLGLWLGAWWAEYLVVVSTGLFVPEELLSCIRKFTWTKVGVLLVNGAILAYVIRIVWQKHAAQLAARNERK